MKLEPLRKGRISLRVVFEFSGSIVFEAEMDHPPPIGAQVQFRTNAYKKGLHAGSLIAVTVGKDDPLIYCLAENQPPEVHISINGYELIESGEAIDEDDES